MFSHSDDDIHMSRLQTELDFLQSLRKHRLHSSVSCSLGYVRKILLDSILLSNKHKDEEASVLVFIPLQSHSHKAKNAPVYLGTGRVKLPASGKSACPAFYIQCDVNTEQIPCDILTFCLCIQRQAIFM